MDRYSFLVRLFHPLLQAGLARRTVMGIFRQLATRLAIYSVLMNRHHSVFSGLSKQHFLTGFWPVAFALLAGTCTAQASAERMEQLVQPFADAQVFMGSVLVAQDGKVLFNKSYGSADLEWSIPNSPTTRFQIASMTKQFTAASILLMEERGKLWDPLESTCRHASLSIL